MNHRGLNADVEMGPGPKPTRVAMSLEERVARLERRLGAVVSMQDREKDKLDSFRDVVLSPSEAPERSAHPYTGEEESGADVDPRY